MQDYAIALLALDPDRVEWVMAGVTEDPELVQALIRYLKADGVDVGDIGKAINFEAKPPPKVRLKVVNGG